MIHSLICLIHYTLVYNKADEYALPQVHIVLNQIHAPSIIRNPMIPTIMRRTSHLKGAACLSGILVVINFAILLIRADPEKIMSDKILCPLLLLEGLLLPH